MSQDYKQAKLACLLFESPRRVLAAATRPCLTQRTCSLMATGAALIRWLVALLLSKWTQCLAARLVLNLADCCLMRPPLLRPVALKRSANQSEHSQISVDTAMLHRVCHLQVLVCCLLQHSRLAACQRLGQAPCVAWSCMSAGAACFNAAWMLESHCTHIACAGDAPVVHESMVLVSVSRLGLGLALAGSQTVRL